MTITHQLKTYSTTTHYDPTARTLTRILGSQIAIVTPNKNTIEELYRLSQLEDHIFQDLAYLQQQRRNRNDTQKI